MYNVCIKVETIKNVEMVKQNEMIKEIILVHMYLGACATIKLTEMQEGDHPVLSLDPQ